MRTITLKFEGFCFKLLDTFVSAEAKPFEWKGKSDCRKDIIKGLMNEGIHIKEGNIIVYIFSLWGEKEFNNIEVFKRYERTEYFTKEQLEIAKKGITVPNKVIRICLECKNTGEQDKEFTYLRDGVWSCHNCLCKHTEIKEVIE